MFTSIRDFTTLWNAENESTLKVYYNLTNESLAQAVTPGNRDLGILANHLISALTSMTAQAGLPITPVTAAYTTVEELITGYQQTSKSILQAVSNTWADNSLQEEIKMFGQFMWKKGFFLMVLVLHEVHHRGQMIVLMRQAGLPVPGVYGPSKDEWEAMKLPVPV